MFFTRVVHALTTLCAYIGGLRGVPTSLEQEVLPASILDDGSAALPPLPLYQLHGYAHLIAKLPDVNSIVIPEGLRVNVVLLGGNWTTPSGALLANVLPGVGAEQGYVDSKGLFHLDVRYVVQFVSDKKFGYVQLRGYGTLGVVNKGVVVVETDSAKNLKFNGQLLWAPGAFNGPVLSAPLYSYLDPLKARKLRQ